MARYKLIDCTLYFLEIRLLFSFVKKHGTVFISYLHGERLETSSHGSSNATALIS